MTTAKARQEGAQPSGGQLGSYSVRTVVWMLLGSTEQLPITRCLRPNSSFSSQNSTTKFMLACVFIILLLKDLGTRERRGRERAGNREEVVETANTKGRVTLSINQPGLLTPATSDQGENAVRQRDF